jgi:hypothetical protein
MFFLESFDVSIRNIRKPHMFQVEDSAIISKSSFCFGIYTLRIRIKFIIDRLLSPKKKTYRMPSWRPSAFAIHNLSLKTGTASEGT